MLASIGASLLGLGLTAAVQAAPQEAMTPAPQPSPMKSIAQSPVPMLHVVQEPNQPAVYKPIASTPGQIRPVVMQRPDGGRPPGGGPGGGGDDSQSYKIQLKPPDTLRLFRLEAESALQERMRQEALSRGERINFPEEPNIATGDVVTRMWPPMTEIVEPAYVCYGRLKFEHRNEERYGWDLGFIAPFVSTGYFFADVALLPYKCFTQPTRCCECSAGYCLPGDPVPYLCTPPQYSLSGLTAETAIVFLLIAIFP